MKKTILILLLLSITAILYAKDKSKLTAEEIIAIDAFIEPLPDPNLVRRVEKQKDYHHTNSRCCDRMGKLKTWIGRVKANLVKCKRRADGEYVVVDATIDDITPILGFERQWLSDPNYIEDILMKLRCPLDGHLYADDTGVAE